MVTAAAPGKMILFGEHAVVYGRPAIAVPVWQVRAEATVEAWPGDSVEIDAPDIGRHYALDAAPEDDPIATAIRKTCARLGQAPRGLLVRIRSTIPVARGLGSGAAVSVAVARALAHYWSASLPPEDISALAYEVEKLHHGTPSGIDNTVIAFGRPVYFVRGQPIESFNILRPFTMAIADTGVAAPTRIAVGDVRKAWEADRPRFEALFDQVAEIVQNARAAIEQGLVEALGPLMNANQALLRQMTVSSPEVERLVEAALESGAHGAKISGAGRGGNVIALVDVVTQDVIERALRAAGAVRVIATTVSSNQ